MRFVRPDWMPDLILQSHVISCLSELKRGRLAKAARILSASDVAYWGPTAAAGISYVREPEGGVAETLGLCIRVVRELVSVPGVEGELESAVTEKLSGTDVVSECIPFRLDEYAAAWHFQFLRGPVGSSSKERKAALLLRGYILARLDSPWHTLMEVLDT